MFRITFDERPYGIAMRIEGRFAGHFAEEARQLIALRTLPAEFHVDVSDVTFVDSAGEDALVWLNTLGGRFVANSSDSLHLCDRLQLARNGHFHTTQTVPP